MTQRPSAADCTFGVYAPISHQSSAGGSGACTTPPLAAAGHTHLCLRLTPSDPRRPVDGSTLQPVLDGPSGSSSSRVDPQLPQHVPHMRVRGSFGNNKFGCDLTICESAGAPMD